MRLLNENQFLGERVFHTIFNEITILWLCYYTVAVAVEPGIESDYDELYCKHIRLNCEWFNTFTCIG